MNPLNTVSYFGSFLARSGGRLVLAVVAFGLVACASGPTARTAAARTKASREILISVKDQKMALLEQGRPVAVYPVSTSKFGLGDTPGSYSTPLGKMKIAQKIGNGAPAGAVFKHRRPTGEILPPNAPGRDPIVTRILRLTGEEPGNARAFARHIYIHGTPEETTIGRPASFGCVRMRSEDVIDLFNRVPTGTNVQITQKRLPTPVRLLALRSPAGTSAPTPAAAPPAAAPLQVVPVPKPALGTPQPQLASTQKFGPAVP